MKGYIYIMTNLITHKQYVGQTMHTITDRYKHHIHEAKFYKDTMYIHESMRKYGFDNFSVDELMCIEVNTKQELSEKLNQWEKHYIQTYNTLKPNGYNLSIGGSGLKEKGKILVDEYDLDGNYIKTHNSLIDAARSVGSNRHTSISRCCNGKNKFAFQRVWRFHGEPFDKYEAPNKFFAERKYKLAKIDQYDLNGNYIKTFESISSACRELHVSESSSHISECCMGKLHSIYGYIWRYHNQLLGDYSDSRTVSINKFDLNGNFIKCYSSLKEACLDIGKDYNDTVSGNIRKCCKGERNTAYKFKWEYAN